MSHEITVRKDGTEEMFAAGSTPVWHRIGQGAELKRKAWSTALEMSGVR
jgi:hypothetical protein